MDETLAGRLVQSLSGEDAEDARIAAQADKIATYFTPNQRLKYLGVAGIGTHGGTIIFSENDDNDRPFRKIVIKYSLDEQADEDLRNEARWLEVLRGAEHIGQTIPIAETELNVSGTGKRPTLALEFIPNGTVTRFRQKMNEHRFRTPSRFLWRVLLCMVRQTIAMAYPPRGGPNAPLVREVIQPGVAPYTLSQNSGHGDNMLFGDIAVDTAEHGGIVPVLKLIDFGRGAEDETFEWAHVKRSFNIGYIIVLLALPNVSPEGVRAIGNQQNSYAFIDSNRQPTRIPTYAPDWFLNYVNIDVPLRDLVARCMAINPSDQPPLEEVLRLCEYTVAHRGPDDMMIENRAGHGRRTETDPWIQHIVQQCMLNAPTVHDTPELIRLQTNSHIGTTILGLAPIAIPYQKGDGQKESEGSGEPDVDDVD